MRVLRDPFVQFLILGAAIFAAYGLVRPTSDLDRAKRIVVDGPAQASLYDNFRKQFGRLPSREEMEALVQADIGHEVKYREALALGLDEGDSIVRRRMMQKFDFLYGTGAVATTPADQVLESWYENRLTDYAAPARIDFEHAWYSPDRRGDSAETDAREALEQLNDDAAPAGDAFPGSRRYESATNTQVRASFGERFAQEIFAAPTGEWSGPIASGLGYHLVLIESETKQAPRALDEIRDTVLRDWRKWESDRIAQQILEELSAQYRIEIDKTALAKFEYAPEPAPR